MRAPLSAIAAAHASVGGCICYYKDHAQGPQHLAGAGLHGCRRQAELPSQPAHRLHAPTQPVHASQQPVRRLTTHTHTQPPGAAASHACLLLTTLEGWARVLRTAGGSLEGDQDLIMLRELRGCMWGVRIHHSTPTNKGHSCNIQRAHTSHHLPTRILTASCAQALTHGHTKECSRVGSQGSCACIAAGCARAGGLSWVGCTTAHNKHAAGGRAQ